MDRPLTTTENSVQYYLFKRFDKGSVYVICFVDPKKTALINPQKNIYPMDKELPLKLKNWSMIFMGMLLKIWKNMDNKCDYDIPESIRMETENYKNEKRRRIRLVQRISSRLR